MRNKLIKSIRNKEGLPEHWKEPIIVPVYKTGATRDCSNYICQLRTKFYPASCCPGLLRMQRKLLGIINVDFDAKGQLLIIFSAFAKYLRKVGRK
jgi:hypothetical protein